MTNLWSAISALVAVVAIVGFSTFNVDHVDAQTTITTTAPTSLDVLVVEQPEGVVTGGERATTEATETTSSTSSSVVGVVPVCYSDEFNEALEEADAVECLFNGSTISLSAEQLRRQQSVPASGTVDLWRSGGLVADYGSRSIPLSSYDLSSDNGSIWDLSYNPLVALMAFLTEFAFRAGVILTMIAVNVSDWAFSFPAADALVGEGSILAKGYAFGLLGYGTEASAYQLALAFAMVVVGFRFINKGIVAGSSEAVLSVAGMTIATVVIATSSFGNLGLWVADTSSGLAGHIAVAGTTAEAQQRCREATSPTSLAGAVASTSNVVSDQDLKPACSLAHALQKGLVEQPYQTLQWGRTLDDVEGLERCSQVSWEILEAGGVDKVAKPWDRMKAYPECVPFGEFNQQVSLDRLTFAGFNLVNTFLVSLLIIVVAMMLLWQLVKIMYMTALKSFVLVAAILPGPGRALAYEWLRSMLGIVVHTGILALFLVVYMSAYGVTVSFLTSVGGVVAALLGSLGVAVAGYFALWKLWSKGKRFTNAAGKAVQTKLENPAPPSPEFQQALNENQPRRSVYGMVRRYDRTRQLGRRLVPSRLAP